MSQTCSCPTAGDLGLRPARRRHLDRHRHHADGRLEPPDLAHRLPRRMRPQRRETPNRPGPGPLPALERQPRRPPHLGTAAATARIKPATNTPAPAWLPNRPRRLSACHFTGLPNTYVDSRGKRAEIPAGIPGGQAPRPVRSEFANRSRYMRGFKNFLMRVT